MNPFANLDQIKSYSEINDLIGKKTYGLDNRIKKSDVILLKMGG